MILGVQVQEDPFEKINNFIGNTIAYMMLAYILGIVTYKPSKKELLKRIDILESEIISKYLAVNEQVILA